MTKNMSAAVALFEELVPPRTRKRLNLGDLTALTGAILIKDRISVFFKNAAREEAALRRFKRSHGYCGGYVACLHYVGMNQSLCDACTRAAAAHTKRARSGAPRLNRQSEYGQMRAKERKLERAEKERLGSGP